MNMISDLLIAGLDHCSSGGDLLARVILRWITKLVLLLVSMLVLGYDCQQWRGSWVVNALTIWWQEIFRLEFAFYQVVGCVSLHRDCSGPRYMPMMAYSSNFTYCKSMVRFLLSSVARNIFSSIDWKDLVGNLHWWRAARKGSVYQFSSKIWHM